MGDKDRYLRPGQQRDKGDSNNQCVLDTKGHQVGRQDATAEDGYPELERKSVSTRYFDDGSWVANLGIRHFSALAHASIIVEPLGRASS